MPARIVLEIHAEVQQWKIPKLLQRSLATIANAVVESGNEKSGSPYAQFRDMDWETVLNEGVVRQLVGLLRRRQKIQIGIPVQHAVGVQHPVTCYELNLGECVIMTHRGPHHLVINTYREIYAWAKQREIKLQPRALESYVSDPAQTKAPDLETLVAIPLAK